MTGDFVIGLGSNLGDRVEQLCGGATLIAALSQVRVLAVSSVFETDAVGPPQPRYLNAALRLHSALDAHALLKRLRAVEHARGRPAVEQRVRWGPRTLDLDVLWASVPVRSEQLTVPHARMHERNFALAPLLELAPELAPVYGQMLAAIGGAPHCVGRLVMLAQLDAHGADTQQVVFERSTATPV